VLQVISRTLDSITTIAAEIVKWIVLVLALLNCYEVIMRYLFNKPSIWAFDLSYMLGGAFFALGMGYAWLTKAHVRVDVLYVNFSQKIQALIDIVLSLIFFFPAFTLLLIKLVPWVIKSWDRKEKASGSFWLPPIYPLKTVILVAVALLVLQGISELCKDIMKLTNNDEEKVK